MEELLLSSNCSLNEQIAQEIFDTLPENGPIMIIMDKEGNSWTSNPEEFSKLRIDESFFRALFAKIDDGAEPVITQANECSIIAAQLATEQTNCGYVIIALPQYNPKATLTNIDLIETLLNQISLVAKLMESNNLLRELQMKQLSSYTRIETASN